MSGRDFNRLFDRIDNGFVGSEDHVYNYQKKYTDYFTENVLDIGCGQGAFLRALTEAGISCTGLDLNLVNVETCRAKGYAVVHGDMWHYLENLFVPLNGISLMHVIEHFGGYEAVQLLVACYESLKSSGRLVLITPNFADDHIHKTNFWLSSSHIRPYPVEWLRNAFQEIGFKVIDSGHDSQGGDTFIVGEK